MPGIRLPDAFHKSFFLLLLPSASAPSKKNIGSQISRLDSFAREISDRFPISTVSQRTARFFTARSPVAREVGGRARTKGVRVRVENTTRPMVLPSLRPTRARMKIALALRRRWRWRSWRRGIFLNF